MVNGIVGHYFVINAVIVNNIQDIQIFQINVIADKYWIVKKRLEIELRRAIRILNTLKNDGLINSVAIPKNKNMQKQLNILVNAKKVIRKSLKQLKDFYT